MALTQKDIEFAAFVDRLTIRQIANMFVDASRARSMARRHRHVMTTRPMCVEFKAQTRARLEAKKWGLA